MSTWFVVINILAVLLSPLIAVRVSAWLQNRKEKREARMLIFSSLMALRYMPVTDQIVQAMNMIDIVFDDEEKIRKLWREYYEMLCNAETRTLWDDKRNELITEMAKAVGYGESITMMDVKRVYSPIGLTREKDIARATQEQMLRLLSQSEVALKADNKDAAAPPEMKK